ncbi:porin [Mangrovibrevibacter kandeliae]|uniref:porin n=1 Tax=Mangrovibrevibacter kandeliae TaxID=2968473 RepID=UPI0021182C3F|nr:MULTISPECIES: porin [unclassified Aurantimonas]MCQ8781124.1 porin [Aurantimonas sp. CSK15Z-1]MCW4113904.1 porin [Aurantimonas sp. MSK8Z-1]
MNIKSLLLGSAAALVAVSGARAADAVVMAEPEPVEYVRVCDVYGAGFFYIPGTETCMKIGGYVRYQVEAATNIDNTDLQDDPDGTGDYRVSSRVRTRLNFDVREETELGTLRAYARVQATNRFGGDASYVMPQAYIQLGGLTMGYLDSLWTTRDGLLIDEDYAVGDYTANRASYTFTFGGGFDATISLEDDGSGDWTPDVLAQLGYAGGWGEAYITGAYDEQVDGLFGTADDDDGSFALKAGILLKDLFVADSQFKVEGTYAFDPNVYNTDDGLGTFDISEFGIENQSFDPLPLEWSIGAGYAQGFGRVGVAVAAQYLKTFDFTYAGSNTELDIYRGAVDVGYELTKNFDVLAEVRYTYLDGDRAAGDFDADQTAGFLRFQRNF